MQLIQLDLMDWASRRQHSRVTSMIVSALLVLTSLRGSSAFSSGNVEVACDSMTPLHGVGPQSNSPPYAVTGIQNPDGSINVKLDSTGAGDDIFEGFLMQARDSSGSRVGVFSNQPASAQLLNCDFPGGAVSHKGNSKKTSVDVLWQPQGYTGDVQFRATVVRSFATFWTGVTSQNFAVQPIQISPPVTGPSPDSFPGSNSPAGFQPPIQIQPSPQPPNGGYQPPNQPQQPDGGYQPQQPDGGYQPPTQPQQPDGGYQPPTQPQQPDGGYQPPSPPQQPDGGYQPQQPDGGYQPPTQPQQPDGGYQPPFVSPPNPSPGIFPPPTGYLPPFG